MRVYINHITKTEFLPCFKAAFNTLVTKNNILGGFRGASLVPFDPEAVISKLEVRLRTPTPPTADDSAWESRTPSNTLEFGSQSKLIRKRIQRHIDSSPTSMVEALEKFTKGAEMMAHSMVLMTKRNAELQAADEAATRRKSHKRKRIQREGVLTVEEGLQLTTPKEFSMRSDGKKAKKRVHANASGQPSRRCGRCGEAGHNARTCKQQVEIVFK